MLARTKSPSVGAQQKKCQSRRFGRFCWQSVAIRSVPSTFRRHVRMKGVSARCDCDEACIWHPASSQAVHNAASLHACEPWFPMHQVYVMHDVLIKPAITRQACRYMRMIRPGCGPLSILKHPASHSGRRADDCVSALQKCNPTCFGMLLPDNRMQCLHQGTAHGFEAALRPCEQPLNPGEKLRACLNSSAGWKLVASV
jgi:hypothetical protein